MEALLDGEAEELTRKAIDLAKAGDMAPLRLCFERLVPVRRDRPVQFPLPVLDTVQDAKAAMASLLASVASGDLTPTEASEIAKLVENYIRAIEATEFEERLSKLERMTRQ